MYDTLEKYKEEHGDCLVPQRYLDDPKLGRWVNKQRENKDKLLPERRKLLDEIGFTWRVVQREPWHKMFERLIEYRESNGNCLVPQRYKKDPRLGCWVREQRKRKRLMPVDRKRRLDSIDFIWKAKKQDKKETGETPDDDEDMIGDAIEDGMASLQQSSMLLNMNNIGRLGMAALSSQQPNLTAAAAPISVSLPQNRLGMTIGPVVQVVNPLAASGMMPSLQTQSSLTQPNWNLAGQQQGQTAEQQANQLALYQMQMLQAKGLGLLHGGAPPLSRQLVQQSLAIPVAPVAPGVPPLAPRQPVQQSLTIPVPPVAPGVAPLVPGQPAQQSLTIPVPPVAPVVAPLSGQLAQQSLAIPAAPATPGLPDLRNIQAFVASQSATTPQTTQMTASTNSAPFAP